MQVTACQPSWAGQPVPPRRLPGSKWVPTQPLPGGIRFQGQGFYAQIRGHNTVFTAETVLFAHEFLLKPCHRSTKFPLWKLWAHYSTPRTGINDDFFRENGALAFWSTVSTMETMLCPRVSTLWKPCYATKKIQWKPCCIRMCLREAG